MSIVGMVGEFVGGVGLFLLGMHLMTEGMKVAAGRALKEGLRRSTRTRTRALLAGAVMTGVVQSSSAVTVATLGFVNAGLLGLGHAVWVIYGSNVGTTVTGWLVAATGFDVDLEVFALPAIGLGMLLRITGAGKRRGALGEAIAGFGLFFLGLGVLQGAFADLAGHVDLSALRDTGALARVLYLLVGVLLTVATQSSSAAIALTLTAASGGVLDMQDAAAMVIGANLGTTSTAVLSVLGGTADARRAAAAHVAFNLLTAVVALLLLPFLVSGIAAAIGGDRAPAATVLAMFHTVFNVLGVVIMVPLSDRLVRRLETRFMSRQDEASRPRHLDATVLEVPSVAVRALVLETRRVGALAGGMLADVLAEEPPTAEELAARRASFQALVDEVSAYVSRLHGTEMARDVADRLTAVVRAEQRYLIVAEQAQDVAALLAPFEPEDLAWLAPVVGAALAVIEAGDPERDGFELAACERAFGAFQERYRVTVDGLLSDITEAGLDARRAVRRRHVLDEIRRGVKQLLRAAERLELAGE